MKNTKPVKKRTSAPLVQRFIIPLLPGTITRWGRIGAVGLIDGERYYWMIDADGDVAMMPACVVE